MNELPHRLQMPRQIWVPGCYLWHLPICVLQQNFQHIRRGEFMVSQHIAAGLATSAGKQPHSPLV
jgi:hypothetical protein